MQDGFYIALGIESTLDPIDKVLQFRIAQRRHIAVVDAFHAAVGCHIVAALIRRDLQPLFGLLYHLEDFVYGAGLCAAALDCAELGQVVDSFCLGRKATLGA